MRPEDRIGSINFNGMGSAELKSLINSGSLIGGMRTIAEAKLAGVLQKEARIKESAASATPAAPAAAAPNMDALNAASDKWVAGQNADIERQKEQGLATGLSNMIGSGLAGTSVVGGMTAGVNEAATRAKTNVAGQAEMQKQGMQLQYANLAQAANEGALNRQFQAGENALNRENSVQLGAMGTPIPQSTSTPGLDAFGQPMAGSMQSKMLSQGKSSGPAAGQSSGMSSYPAIQAAVKDAFSFWG